VRRMDWILECGVYEMHYYDFLRSYTIYRDDGKRREIVDEGKARNLKEAKKILRKFCRKEYYKGKKIRLKPDDTIVIGDWTDYFNGFYYPKAGVVVIIELEERGEDALKGAYRAKNLDEAVVRWMDAMMMPWQEAIYEEADEIQEWMEQTEYIPVR